MTMNPITEGYAVFLHDGDKSFGAVRQVHREMIVIYVEDAGDFEVPRAVIKDVHDGKVLLDAGKISADLKKAIGHAHADEDPRI